MSVALAVFTAVSLELEGVVRETYFPGCSDHSVATAIAQLGTHLGLRITNLELESSKISLNLSGKINEPIAAEILSALIDISGDRHGCTARIDATVDTRTLQNPGADAIKVKDCVESSILDATLKRLCA